jgi:hypothetical protein
MIEFDKDIMLKQTFNRIADYFDKTESKIRLKLSDDDIWVKAIDEKFESWFLIMDGSYTYIPYDIAKCSIEEKLSFVLLDRFEKQVFENHISFFSWMHMLKSGVDLSNDVAVSAFAIPTPTCIEELVLKMDLMGI